MYYPLLRGKREELLALQELLEAGIFHHSIIPIIEPISLSPTLISTMEMFIKKERQLYIIDNPIVGHFDDDMSISELPELPDNEENRKEIKKHERALEYKGKYLELHTNEYIKHALYMVEDYEHTYFQLVDSGIQNIAVLCSDEDEVDTFKNLPATNVANIGICFMPEIGLADEITCPAVIFRNKFTKETRNSDYVYNTDELYSRDHILYSSNGFVGFSDYSIIGKKYDETGYAPYAVAIHIVYHKIDSPALRIKHFASDSNDTIKNTPRKFSEAAKKLVKWHAENPHISSLGLEELEKYYLSGKYPGLGSVKRYSLMHHLELIGRFL